MRLTFTSHLRVVRCGDGRSVQEVTDIRFLPGSELEEFGVEDPRITAIDDRYYFTYVAVSRHGAATALASTTDFRDFDRQGTSSAARTRTWSCSRSRSTGIRGPASSQRGDAVLPARDVGRRSQDIIHWGRHGVSPRGWSGMGDRPRRRRARRRCVSPAAGSRSTTATASRPGPARWANTRPGPCCSTRRTPAKILKRTPESIFEPTADFERHGFVPDVVFPTGSSRPRTRSSSITARPIPAPRWSSFRRTR